MSEVNSQQDQQFKLQIVESAEGISEFAEAWDDLFACAVDAPPFLSRTWISTFVEEGRIRGTPLFILVWSGSKLVALYPLTVHKSMNVKIAKPIGTGQPSYLGILLDPAYPEAVHCIADAVRSRRIVDLLYIEDLWSTDKATNTFFERLAGKHFLVRRIFRNPCFFIRLDCSYEEYMKNAKSTKSRQTLGRKERRLREKYKINVEYYNSSEITADIIHRIVTIQEQSWMQRRGAAVLGRPFYQELLLAMAQAGLASVWLLTIDDADAAFVLSLVAHKRLYYVWTAFHMEYSSSLSIGQFLTNWAIRDACRDGILLFDFGHGDAEYKRFWSTGNNSVHRAVAGQGIRGCFLAVVYVFMWKMARVKKLRSFYHRIKRVMFAVSNRRRKIFMTGHVSLL